MDEEPLGIQFFDAHPHIGQKPGSQGTLFRQPKPIDSVRYGGAKGYSPERRGEMQDMVTVHGPTRRMQGLSPTKWEVEDAIYRSSAPVPETPLDVHIKSRASGLSDKDFSGVYHHAVSEADKGRATIAFQRAGAKGLTDVEGTVLHEMGHHRSWDMLTPHHGAWGPEGRGREEAYADDFMMTHHVPRRNEPTGTADLQSHTEQRYEQPTGWHGYVDQPGIAHAAYMGARTTSTAHSRDQELMRQQYAENNNRHPVLFSRNADVHITDTHRDFGQFGYSAYHLPSGEQQLDTIRVGQGPPADTWKPGTGVLREHIPLDEFMDRRGITNYEALNQQRREPLSRTESYARYGYTQGVDKAVDDWKEGKFRG